MNPHTPRFAMNLRLAYTHLRLRRAFIVLCIAVTFNIALWAAGIWFFLTEFGFKTINAGLIANIMLALVAAIALLGWIFSRAFTISNYKYNGLKLFLQSHYADAEASFRKAMVAAENLAAADPIRGDILTQLSAVARALGNFDDAEQFGQRAVACQELAWGDDHPYTAAALEELAATNDRIARYSAARSLLERAVKIREAGQRRDPSAYTACLRSLGELWCRTENWEQADLCFRRVFEVIQRILLAPPEQLVIASDQSLVYVHLNRLDEADAVIQAGLAVAEKNPQPHGLPIAYCLSRLAYVRRFQERFEEAETIVRQSMAIVQKAAPANRLALNGDLHLLGVILRHQSRWAEAEECFRETLQLRDEYLAPEDLAIARVLEDYAELLELMGRAEEAHTNAHRALQIREFHSPFRIV